MFLILRVPSTDAPQRQRKRQHIGQPAQPNGVVRQQPGAARRGADGRLFGRETTLRRATLSTAAQVIYAHTHTHTAMSCRVQIRPHTQRGGGCSPSSIAISYLVLSTQRHGMTCVHYTPKLARIIDLSAVIRLDSILKQVLEHAPEKPGRTAHSTLAHKILLCCAGP